MNPVTKLPIKTKRAAPRSWNQDNIRAFTVSEHEYMIKDMAKGLEKDEILAYLGLEYTDLCEYDRFFFDVTFARGRVDQKHHAVLKLVESMSGKTALASSLAYLTRFGNSTWKAPEGTGEKIAKGIKIVVDTGEGF